MMIAEEDYDVEVLAIGERPTASLLLHSGCSRSFLVSPQVSLSSLTDCCEI